MTSSGIDLYRSFIESFVELGDGVHFNWVVERGKYPDFPENDAANALLSALSDDQRRTLAAMLVDARVGGIHDSLVVLHERLELNDARYAEAEVEMALMPFGFTLFQDYVNRRLGHEWPNAVPPNTSFERTRGR